MLPFLTKIKKDQKPSGGVIAVNFQDFIEFYHLFSEYRFSFTQIFWPTVSYFCRQRYLWRQTPVQPNPHQPGSPGKPFLISPPFRYRGAACCRHQDTRGADFVFARFS